MKAASVKKYLLWSIVLIIFFSAKQVFGGDDNKYDIKNIKQELLQYVNAVVRNYSLTFTVDDIDEAHLKCIYAVTILNKQGEHFGQLRLDYDKFENIKRLKGHIYDLQGKEIGELDDEEIKDYALISWATLYSDNRTKIATIYHNEYPYTIEYEYEIVYDGYNSWPTWVPEEKDASVEYSSYNIIVAADSGLRYRSYNMDDKPVIKQINKKQVSYLWEVTNLPSFQEELFGPSILDQYKSVVTAPCKFKMDDYEGDLSTWKEFGRWNLKLWKSKQDLPEKAINEIHSLITGISDKKEQIKKIYKYLQSKTRYVNIQVGIGGWQPIEAEKVYERGYGDCKALSNFMIALLKYADIKAYPVLIYNDDIPNRQDTSFARSNFNHVIVCVPLNSDTVWLECTSQTSPFNHVGNSNENRYALFLGDDGGRVIRIPSSKPESNQQIRTAKVKLLANGKSTVDISTTYTGNLQDEINYVFNDFTNDELDDWIKDELNISSFSIVDKSFTHTGENSSVLKVNLALPIYGTTMGNRLYFNPLLIKSKINIPENIKKRKYPVLFSYPQCNQDTIIYQIPEGYSIEAKPEEVNFESENYSFKSVIKIVDGSTIVYTRYYEIKKTELPPEEYSGFKKFLQTVVESDSRKIVLLKK